jgi:hypothetical protein
MNELHIYIYICMILPKCTYINRQLRAQAVQGGIEVDLMDADDIGRAIGKDHTINAFCDACKYYAKHNALCVTDVCT